MEESDFPPGFPETWSPSVNHRQQAGEYVSFQAETKFFHKLEVQGKWKIVEDHRHGIREIVIPINSKLWISNRLRWKGSNPGIYTSRLRWFEQGVTVFISEKSNRWGIYTAIQVKENQKSSFVIIPGGESGALWKAFALWLSSEGEDSRVPAAKSILHRGTGSSPTHQNKPPLRRSYAEAVHGVPLIQTNADIASLQIDITSLKATVKILMEKVRQLEKHLDTSSVDAGSRTSNSEGDTLVQNTAVEDDAELDNAHSNAICDVIPDVMVELAADGFGGNDISNFHLVDRTHVQTKSKHKADDTHVNILCPGQNTLRAGIDVIVDGTLVQTKNVSVHSIDKVNVNFNVPVALGNPHAFDVAEGGARQSGTALFEGNVLTATRHTEDENIHKSPIITNAAVKRLSSINRWKRAFFKLKKQRDEHIYEMWTTEKRLLMDKAKAKANSSRICKITEITRAGKNDDTSTLQGESLSTATVNLSDDECETYISPFQNEEVPGILNIIRDEQERDIAAGINAGYPEFLARIEVGVDSIASWLCKLDSSVLSNPNSTVKKLGRKFQWDVYAFYGLTVWTALVPSPIIKTSDFLYPCWKRLIGRPILAFLEKEGIETSEQWFEDGPPRLSAIFGKARWQFP